MAGKAGEIVVKFSAQTGDLTRGLKTAQNELGKTQISTRMMGISIQRAGAVVAQGAKVIGGAMLGMSAVVAGAGLAVVNQASKWESSFTDVSKVLDPATTNIAKLEKELLNLTKTLPISSNEIAEVAASAGRLGIEGEGNILKFTETMIAMGVATNLTAEQAGDEFAKFANKMNMPIGQVDKLGSTVVNLGNNLPTTERDIVNLGGRIASAGRKAGLSSAEVMGFSGAISATGISSERGGTNMSKFLRTVERASKEGGKHLDVLAKVSGMTADEFKQSFQDDASGAIVQFLKGMSEMDEQGLSTAGIFEDLNMNSSYMHELLGNLSGNIELVENSLGYANKGWEENSALMDEAEQRYATFASLIQLVKNNFNLLAIVIGKEVMAVLSDLLKALMPAFDYLHRLAEMFTELSEPVKRAVIYIGMAVSALLAIGGVFMFVVAGIATMVSMFGLFLAGVSAIGVSLGGLIAIVTGVVSVIALIGGAIIGAVAMFGLLIARSQTFREAIVSAFQGIAERAGLVFKNIKILALNMWEIITDFWENDIKDFVTSMETLFKPILDKIKEFGESKGIANFGRTVFEVRQKVEEGFSKMMTFIGEAMNLIGSIFEKSAPLIEGLLESFMIVFNGAKDIVMAVMPIIGDTISSTLSKIKTFWDENGDAIMTVVQKVFPIIQGIIKGVMVAIKFIVVPILHAIKNIFTGTLDIILGLVSFFSSAFTGDWRGAFDAVVQIVTGVFKVVIGWLDLFVFRGLLSKGKVFLVGIKSVFSFKGIANLVKTFISKVKDFFSFDTVLTKTSGFFSKLRGFFTFKNIDALVINFIDKVARWLSLKPAIATVKNFFSSLRGFFTFSNIKSLLSSFKTFVGNIFSTMFSAVLKVVTMALVGILNIFTSGLGAVKEFVTSIVDGIIDTFSSIWTGVKGILTSLIDGIVEFFHGLYMTLVGNSIIPDMVEAIIEWIINLKDKFLDYISDLVSGVVEWFAGLKDKAVEKVKSMVEGVVDTFTTLYDSIHEKMMIIKDIIDLVWSFIKITFGNALEFIKALVDGDFGRMKEIIDTQMKTVRMFLKVIWTKILELVGERVAKILESVRQKFLQIKESISKRIEQAKEALVNKFTTMVSNAKSKATEIWNSIKEKFEQIKTTITNKLEQAKNNLVNKFSTMVSNAKSKVSEIWSNITSRFEQIKSTITNKLEQAKNNLVNRFTTMVSNAKRKASEIVSTVRAKFTEVVSRIKEKMSEAVQAVVKFLGQMPGKVRSKISEMATAGKDLIRGLIRGIKGMGKDAVEAITGVVGGVVRKAKNFLKIKSPSRVFMDIGKDTGAGMVVGLDKSGREVEKASKRMAESAMIEPQKFEFDHPDTAGFRSQISSAVRNTVDVDTRDGALISSINNLRSDLTNLRVDMDGREVGRVVAPHVKTENDRFTGRKTAFGG